MALTQRQRVRRTAILCCHCLRNIAFYRSWQAIGQPYRHQQFWITANSNFLDIAVLEWCKLFSDKRGKHSFDKATVDREGFFALLLEKLRISENDLARYADGMKAYRDQFIAHLDEGNTYQVPDLGIAIESTILLYDYLLDQERAQDTLHDAQEPARSIYEAFATEGLHAYRSQSAT